MPFSSKFIKELDKLEPDLKAVLLQLLGEIERNRDESITRKEFREFAQTTEDNFQKVWTAIGELTEAQKRTEQRVGDLAAAQKKTEQRVEDVAVAQKQTEQRLEELAVAQKQTEQRLEELAVAQKHTEQRLEELTVAQKKTEETMRKLILRVDDLDDRVGGLSNTFGHVLEDQSYPALEKVLKRDFRFQVEKLYRKNIVYSANRFDEINIYGEASRNGEKVYIIGECKAQFGVRDVAKFTKLLERIQTHLGDSIFPIALAYHFHPRAEEKLREHGIKYFWSYELIER